MFCSGCGTENQSDSRFCSSCGKALPMLATDTKPETESYSVLGNRPPVNGRTGFLTAIVRGWSRGLNFQDRATRAEYWWFMLFYYGGSYGLAVLEGIIWGRAFLAYFFIFILLIPSIAVRTRRLHDIDTSGWYQLMLVIPLINILFFIWCGLAQGSVGGNKYGKRD